MRYRKLKVSGWKNRTRQAGARLALLALAALWVLPGAALTCMYSPN